MTVFKTLAAVAAVAALATPALAGKTAPTPTPIAPGMGAVVVVPSGRSIGAIGALEAIMGFSLPATLTSAQKARLLAVLNDISRSPAAMRSLGVSPAAVAAAISRVNAVPVRG